MSEKVIRLQCAAAMMEALGCWYLAKVYNKLAAQAMKGEL